jgi:hypothetical protein
MTDQREWTARGVHRRVTVMASRLAAPRYVCQHNGGDGPK